MAIRNSKALKKHNQFTILNEVIERQPISRAELGKTLDVSHATISYLVKDLIEQGLLEETEYSQSTGGRPPILLEFKGDTRYLIAVEVTDRLINYGLFNLNLDLLKRSSYKVDPVQNYNLETVIDNLYHKIEGDLQESDIDLDLVIGLGLSIPGIYKSQDDQIIDSTTKLWERKEIKGELTRVFNLPVYIENDANLAAYYEWSYGVGQSFSNLIYIYLGEGIGGGIIIDNILYRGSHGNAGEIGHIKVKASGKKCECGGIGCLETISSVTAIEEEVNRRLKNGEESILKDMGEMPFSIDQIISAYNRHDYLAVNVMDEAVKYIVSALSSLVNVFDPELLILGGVFNDFSDQLFNKVKDDLRLTCFPNIVDELTLLHSSKKDFMQLHAVASCVFDKWKQKI